MEEKIQALNNLLDQEEDIYIYNFFDLEEAKNMHYLLLTYFDINFFMVI